MKKLLVLGTFACLTVSGVAMARDTVLHLPLADVLAMPEAKEKLDPSIHIYLSGSKTPPTQKQFVEVVTNRKTNAFNKTDEVACRWVALSALIELQEAAKRQGANAVMDVVSYYKKQPFTSATEYECHAGALIAGVALKGKVATVAQ